MELSEVSRNFCRNVWYLRRKHRMTQYTLASLIGIGRSSLQRLETGDLPARFNCTNLCRVCDIFGVSADALIYGDISHLEK